jgi:hypothetical protein
MPQFYEEKSKKIKQNIKEAKAKAAAVARSAATS